MQLEDRYRKLVKDLDAQALDLWTKGKKHEAIQTVTQVSALSLALADIDIPRLLEG